jgi:N6-adenosine-specific RNA methylase IME4
MKNKIRRKTMLKINNEFKDLIPPLTADEYTALEESILIEGCREAIIVWNETIVDGHNRFEICSKYGIEFSTREINFESILDAKVWIRKNQLSRRNLSDAWKLELQFANKADLLEIGREKMSEAGEEFGIGKESVKGLSFIDKPYSEHHNTRKEIAKAAGVSTGKVGQAEVVRKTSPELWEKAKAGEITIGGAYKEAVRIVKQEGIKDRIVEYQNDDLKTMGYVNILETDDKFRIIYADPPWSYNDKCKDGAIQSGGAEIHYNSMSINELCKLPVSNITEDNAVLFLWVTSPLLEECFEVIDAWGFKYKSSFVWDKEDHNMGHYNSVRHEFLLVCTKGSCVPDNNKLYDSVISVKRSNTHSEKPGVVLDIIDDLYQYGNRIELFARGRKKDTWCVWGNEV